MTAIIQACTMNKIKIKEGIVFFHMNYIYSFVDISNQLLYINAN